MLSECCGDVTCVQVTRKTGPLGTDNFSDEEVRQVFTLSGTSIVIEKPTVGARAGGPVGWSISVGWSVLQ